MVRVLPYLYRTFALFSSMILMPWIFLIGIADKFNITSFPEALIIDLIPIILLIVFDIVLLIFAIVRLRPFDVYSKVGFFVASW